MAHTFLQMLNQSRSLRLLFVGALSYMLIPGAFGLPITVNSSNISAIAYDDDTSTTHITNAFTGTAIPTSTSLSITQGSSSSTTGVEWSGDATSAVFSFDMAHSIDNDPATTGGVCCDFAQSRSNTVDGSTNFRFTVNVDTTYSISGFYNADNPGDMSVYSDVRLLDETDNQVLFQDRSWSRSTVDESFTIGDGGDGDFQNTLSGNLTGNLIAGHTYDFLFIYFIQSIGSGNSESSVAATAAGNATLAIGAVPVPEPTTLVLMGLGLAGLGFSRRRRL